MRLNKYDWKFEGGYTMDAITKVYRPETTSRENMRNAINTYNTVKKNNSSLNRNTRTNPKSRLRLQVMENYKYERI